MTSFYLEKKINKMQLVANGAISITNSIFTPNVIVITNKQN